MNRANRRGFLKIAGAGAAAAGTASLIPSAVSAAAAGTAVPAIHRTNPTVTTPRAATGSMVAYIDDVAKGEIAVMVEGREVTVTDHDLITRLSTAVHTAAAASV